MIKGKTPEEIRKTFNIKNDFTEEEEAQVLIPSFFFLLVGLKKKVLHDIFDVNVLHGSVAQG